MLITSTLAWAFLEAEGCWWRFLKHCLVNLLPTNQKKVGTLTSLVVQWLRVWLPMKGTQVWSRLQEDCTCFRATKHEPQLLSPCPRTHALREKPLQWEACTPHLEEPPLSTSGGSLHIAMKTQWSHQQIEALLIVASSSFNSRQTTYGTNSGLYFLPL